jgi:membrane protease YdiL (CAAX protease family)
MMACLPVVGALQELTEMLPWSPAMRQTFKLAEEDYNKQVAVMARMNNFNDYIISVIVIAFLPAVFEETFFRGALQNWLSRWTKKPYLAIIVTAIVFSAVHGSYLGFLSRFALGVVLGWIFYRTGNIWLNIVGHFFNNAFAVTALYKISKATHQVDPSKIDDHYPVWVGLIGLVALTGLYKLFEMNNKQALDLPGEEVMMPGYEHIDNIFQDTSNNQTSNQ